MRQGWRATVLGAVVLTATAGCGSSTSVDAAGGSAPRTSPEAAASAAATAAPGTYGTPVDPSLPDPTNVATDAPSTLAPAAPDAGTTPDDTAAPDDTARVVVTYSGWIDGTAAVELGAYVAGVVESEGTCTLTLTSGPTSVTTAVPAEPDASSTSCPTMAVPGAELTSGSWQAVVDYASPSTSGRSEPVTVAVP